MLLLRAWQSHSSSGIRQAALGAQHIIPFHTKIMSSAEGKEAFAGKGAAELRQRQPGPCSRDTPLLKEKELQEGLTSIPAWELNENSSQISRFFVAKNFVAAIDFFRRVADVAEEANHHPDLHLTDYRNVKVVLTTHAAGGLTAQDLIIAARIDYLPVDYSPKWLRQQQGRE